MKIWIGIDPDTEASGCSMWRDNRLEIFKFSFFQLYDFLGQAARIEGIPVKVIIEAGWLNKKSNWHSEGKGEFVSSRIGAKVGANHQVGKLIVEMCEYLGLEYELSVPKSSKMGIRQFRILTKYEVKLDQDMVDAGMLVFGR